MSFDKKHDVTAGVHLYFYDNISVGPYWYIRTSPYSRLKKNVYWYLYTTYKPVLQTRKDYHVRLQNIYVASGAYLLA